MSTPTNLGELAALLRAQAPMRNNKRRAELAGIPGPALLAVAAAAELYASTDGGEPPAVPDDATISGDRAARDNVLDSLRDQRRAEGLQPDRVSDRRGRELDARLDDAFGPVPPAPAIFAWSPDPAHVDDPMSFAFTPAAAGDDQLDLAVAPWVLPRDDDPRYFLVTAVDDRTDITTPPAPPMPTSDPGGPLQPGEPAAAGHYGPGLPEAYPKTDGADASAGDYRTYRSVSQLEKFGECGMAYRLHYVDRHRDETPSVWSIAGGAFHSMAQRYETDRLAGDTAPWQPDDAARAFGEILDAELERAKAANPGLPLTAYRAANRGREDVQWWFDKGPSMAADYVKLAQASARRPLVTDDGVMGLELDLRGELGQLPVRGIIDQLAVDHAARRLLVIDYKTGSRMPTDPAQLVTYGQLVDQVLAKLAPELTSYTLYGAMLEARRGKLVGLSDLRIGPRRQANVDRFAAFDAAERAGHYIANPGAFCGSCSVRPHCPIMGGEIPANRNDDVSFQA